MKHTVYAHVRVGASDVAVPASDIVQAIELSQAGLTPLPRRERERQRGALLGVVAHEGSAVPVVGLDRWLPMGASTAQQAARVLVLRAGASLVAIQVDALLSVRPFAASAICQVCHDGDPDELFETVVQAAPDQPRLGVLQVPRLMALTATWCDAAGLETASAHAAPAATDAAHRRRPAAGTHHGTHHAVFTIGDQRWALPAGALATVTRTPSAELRFAGNRVCGIGNWSGRKLPFADLGCTLDRAGMARPWTAVVTQGQHAIGIVLDRCDRLVKLSADDIGALPGDELRAGTAFIQGLGSVSVLDVARLFDATPEAAISRDCTADAEPTVHTAAAAGGAVDAAGGRSDYLVFEADRSYASPIEGLIGVAALSDSVIDDLSSGRRTAVDWRGESLSVVGMPQIDGGKASFEPKLAVVVKGAGDGARKSAIAVRSLTRWLPARAAHRSTMRMHPIGDVAVVTPAGTHRSESLVVVDLAQMAYLLN